MTDTRPTITVDPACRFGRPSIRGVSTEAVAGMVIAGEALTVVAEEYGLSLREVLLACWFEGSPGEYPQWRQWADTVAYPPLAGWVPLNPAAVEPPPTGPATGG